jgi:pyruvate formate lyase activating enzyme
MAAISTLEQLLMERSAPGSLYEKLSGGRVQCYACAHRCRIPEGQKGICKVRYNHNGHLMVPRFYVGAVAVDPVEKKPFFHVMPGSQAFSFGMLGCDYHCDFCQNWINSQALRNPASEAEGASPMDVSADALVEEALNQKCQIITSTYNEPLITSEWAVDIFKIARRKNLITSYVSNGNATPEVLEFIEPWVDLYKVDLKCFNDQTYRRHIGGTLAPVLDTIQRLMQMGFWVEIVTLVVPGMNDSEKELTDVAQFIASVSKDIPWHVTAFHPDYQRKDLQITSVESINLSWQIGKAAGLRYVYSGNLPGQVGTTEDTQCPGCGKTLIQRNGYKILANHLGPDGVCPSCSTSIPGVWRLPQRT